MPATMSLPHVTVTHFRMRLLVLTCALLLVVGTAPTVECARVLRADVDTPGYTIWEADDVCSQPTQGKESMANVTCSICLSRPGCAIESTTGNCVSVSRINATVDVEYLLAGRNQYCEDTDNACNLCSADNDTSAAVCRGAGGCVCVHQCEVAESVDYVPSSSSFHVYYVLIGAAIVATAGIMARLYRVLSTDIMSTFDLRTRARAAHAANPLTMKLDGWRGFIEKERQDHPENIEIKLCPTRDSEDTSAIEADGSHLAAYEARRNLSAASMEDDNASKQDDLAYVAVLTPRSSTPEQASTSERV